MRVLVNIGLVLLESGKLYVLEATISPDLARTRQHSRRETDYPRACPRRPDPPPPPARLKVPRRKRLCCRSVCFLIPVLSFSQSFDFNLQSDRAQFPLDLTRLLCECVNCTFVSFVPFFPRAEPASRHPVLVSAITLQERKQNPALKRRKSNDRRTQTWPSR